MDDIDRVIAGLSEAKRSLITWGSASQPRPILFDLVKLGLATPATARLTRKGQAVRRRLMGEG